MAVGVSGDRHTRLGPHIPHHAQTLRTSPCHPPKCSHATALLDCPGWALCQECPPPIHHAVDSLRAVCPSTPTARTPQHQEPFKAVSSSPRSAW